MNKRIYLVLAVVIVLSAFGALAVVNLPQLQGDTDAAGDAGVVVRHSPGTAFAAPVLPEPAPLQSGGGTPGLNTESTEEKPEAAAGGGEADAAPALPEDEDAQLELLEEWKNQDPRELIEKKYEDLAERKTEPQNEDNPEEFIPGTGRVDPLTRVRSEVPDELKPPRVDDGDENEFQSYIDSRAASQLVDGLGYSIQVYNLIQIGLEKIVTVSIAGNYFQMGEGSGNSFQIYSPEGIPVTVTLQLTSASTDEVVFLITGQPVGTTISVSKSFSFIPR